MNPFDPSAQKAFPAASGDFHVLVVGGGHAGCEAAAAAAAMGMAVCLLTSDTEKIAHMSCNPAIGGLAKGHLVREIDALGGLMGRLADETGIHFRLLNSSRGGAVQAPRAQSDKALYSKTMKRWLEAVPGLTLIQETAAGVLVKRGRAAGIKTLSGKSVFAEAVIITPGTFLNGLIHMGLQHFPGGRTDDPASTDLARSLKSLGLDIIRLKTGTPMRLHKKSIDWEKFTPQDGDDPPVPFSFQTRKILKNKIQCHMGYTNEKTHDVIRKSLSQSPLYSGVIKGIGPRYCPSIEDKVVKFPHHARHQIFLEPEGCEAIEVYVNGLSSSLPLKIQEEILGTIPGLDQAEIVKPAYGIEYDAVKPVQLSPTLEVRSLPGLYLAGQINGTSGYEEAAAQGLMAGINAALKIQDEDAFILRRDEAYIGVLIDDLIKLDIDEPYRLFTSRAEFRLRLRIDNADRRLMPHGANLSLVPPQIYREFEAKQLRVSQILKTLESTRIKTETGRSLTLKELLKKPDLRFRNVVEWDKLMIIPSDEEIRHLESEIKYEGYIKKQDREIARIRKMDRVRIPEKIDFEKIPGLTRELVEKLKLHKPNSIEEAKRIPGMTPAALVNLHIFLKLDRKRKAAEGHVPRGT